ncbi:hypothetical protein HDU92_003399 [Lobulomyces angularis]|nr:hypothetical protein HDU92_003399 [Lobulomyces angularis]
MHAVTIAEVPLRTNKAVFGVRFQNWMVNEGPKRIFLTLWILANIGYFAYSWWALWTDKNLTTFRSILGWALPTARGAANLLNFNCAAILFTVCRNLISILRTTFLNKLVPFDKNITFHIVIAWCIAFWSYVHCVAHYFNYLYVQQALTDDNGVMRTAVSLALLSGPGLTGQVITIAFFLMITSAVEGVRRKYFEIFWFTHHLFIVFFGATLIHGSFCFIKGDSGDPCRGGATFWKWWVPSAFIFIVERILREVKGRRKTYISKVVQHPSKVVEVQITKPSCKTEAGQYIFLCCPEIAAYEWHPFTLTSSPHEPFISVHIRVVGDWTTKFAERLGCRFGKDDKPRHNTLPYVMVDGPYGSASEDVFDYEVAILVGAGIGVTPFASILKTIWYRLSQPNGLKLLKKVYFIWSCREQSAFEWFQDLLKTLEEDIRQNGPKFQNFLSINSFLTAKMSSDNAHNIYLQEADEENDLDAITGLRARTFFGRPNFDEIFKKVRSTHRGTDVGVFFCGPKVVSGKLHIACNTWTEAEPGGTRFFYGKENF